MKCFLLEVVCLVSILSVARGLTCYGCSSSDNFLVCIANQREMDCPENTDRCGKMYYSSSSAGQGYIKTCLPESYCDKKSNPRCQGNGDKCEIHCCKGGLCNASSVTVISGFLLLVCSVSAFMY